MPKATVAAPPGSRVSEKIVTTTEKPPVTVLDQPVFSDDGDDFKPWTKDFWEYIESLTPADWKDHAARVYRYPNGEKKPRELGRYLVRYDVENPLVNEAQLAKSYGGGQYDVLVHRKRKLIFRASFDIEGPARNPDAAALGANGQAAGGGELATTLNTVLQHLKGMQASAPAEQTPKFQETISMITALTNALPKNEGITGLVSALAALDQLRGGGGQKSDLKETLELLRDLGIIGERAEAKKSKAEELKEILEIADMMRGGGGKRDWVTSLIDAAPTIIEKAGGVLDKAVSVSQNNARIADARARAGLAPLPAAPAQPVATLPAAQTAETREVAPLEKETVDAGAPVVIQPPTFEWVKARAVQLFREGKRGDLIAEFLDNIDPQLGNQLGSLSHAQLGMFISSDPILGEIAQTPRFQEFVGEIVDFFTPEGDAEPQKAN
jgi:hypothetical protein